MPKQTALLTSNARRMRREPTLAERKLWRVLKDGQLEAVHFRRQQPIGPYIADFASLKHKLVIELDGSQHADNQHDIERDNFMQALGWRILRFWNNEINENIEGVLMTIVQALKATPTPALPRQWRERE